MPRAWNAARIGYTAPVGTTEDAHLRHLTVALPPQYAARLFDAQQSGAPDRQLQQIAAEGLKEVYFHDSGRRAGSLEKVSFRARGVRPVEAVRVDGPAVLVCGLPPSDSL